MKHNSTAIFSNLLIQSSDVLPLSIPEICRKYRSRGDLIVPDKDFQELYWLYRSNGEVRGYVLFSTNFKNAVVVDDF